jgi:hypothetical protein
MRQSQSIRPLLNVLAAFALGAGVTWWLGSAMARRTELSPRDDALLRERVRARLADLVTYPDAIEVVVEDGLVRVSGHVLAQEMDGLLLQLTDVPGVYKIRNALDALKDPADLENLEAPGAVPPV